MKVTSGYAEGKAFSVNSPDFTTESASERLHRYEIACEPLLAMALVGGCWAEEEHYPMWKEVLQHLDLRTLSGGSIFWLDLQRYPATLLLYALGLAQSEPIYFISSVAH